MEQAFKCSRYPWSRTATRLPGGLVRHRGDRERRERASESSPDTVYNRADAERRYSGGSELYRSKPLPAIHKFDWDYHR